MAERIPARLTAREGRKFGLTVGIAFLVIAALMLWRVHPRRATFAGGLGAVFVLAGLLIPTYLGPVERGWMGLAHMISKVTTPIFMGVVYFLVMWPIGVIRKLAGGSAIFPKDRSPSKWVEHTPVVSDGERMERQF